MKKEQIQKVIDVLRKVEEAANRENALDMMESSVERAGTVCGTVHCVAGWFAVALNGVDEEITERVKERICDYRHGANKMAQMLGFNDDDDLEDFFDEHPDLWGNYNGRELFCSVDAYDGLDKDSEKPMSIIIAHFEGVKGRLRK